MDKIELRKNGVVLIDTEGFKFQGHISFVVETLRSALLSQQDPKDSFQGVEYSLDSY